ncbi:MAG: hypothetical protein GX379_00090 [Clostridiales bacterium]|jgi:hypothetical protein|nr:hypothetical protein [Clostridiales bacterium]
MKISYIIKMCIYGILVLFGLVFVVAGITNLKYGVFPSVVSIISGLIFSFLSLYHLITQYKLMKCNDENEY